MRDSVSLGGACRSVGTRERARSLAGREAVEGGVDQEWERIEQKLSQLSNFNPTKKKFLTRTNYYGQAVEMDNQGRLLLPQLLRESAQLKGEVAVMGYLNRLEVQSMEAVQKEVAEPFTADDEKNLDELGI